MSSFDRSAEAPRSMTEVPVPLLDADDAPLPDGEAVALPLPAGTEVTLRFPSAFEPFLMLGGTRIVADTGPEARDLLMWSSRRLPALWRALEDSIALRAVSTGGGHIVVTDLVSIEENAFFDHGLLRERLDAANVELARFSLLGAIGTKAELEKRVRATWAPGTLVEVRIEDGGRVVARRRLRVGR